MKFLSFSGLAPDQGRFPNYLRKLTFRINRRPCPQSVVGLSQLVYGRRVVVCSCSLFKRRHGGSVVALENDERMGMLLLSPTLIGGIR